jgi:hypothetical protein
MYTLKPKPKPCKACAQRYEGPVSGRCSGGRIAGAMGPVLSARKGPVPGYCTDI